MLAAIVAIAIVLVVARSSGDDDQSDPTTAPPASTVTAQTTTTVAATPTVAAPQLAASDDTTRRYTVSASPFTVQLAFTSQCWVEARRGGSGGEVLVAQAFEAGDTPAFTESAIWIRLGYPSAATITVNGVPLPAVPSTDPFNVEITAAPASG